ncbi:DNA repair protein RecN [bacterium]|nr:DNA repair protein RecN [candidate division CSSED10-310 bacterium]
MLDSVHIRNYALLNDIELSFSDGLNVVSGETGSGKSILVQAISGLLVTPVEKEKIRPPEKMALIEGYFSGIDPGWVRGVLDDIEMNGTDTMRLILRREMFASGRSRYLVNDQSVPKHIFQEIGRHLLDINSQHEHQKLLDARNHLEFLDRALDLESPVAEIVRFHNKLQVLSREIMEMEVTDRKRTEQARTLEDRMAEIDAASLLPDEKSSLADELKRLRHADELKTLLDEIVYNCRYAEQSLLTQAGRLSRLLQKAVQHDSGLEPLAAQAESVFLILDDLGDTIRQKRDQTDWTRERLNEVAERLHFLQSMEAKYQNDIPGIIAYRGTIEEELSQLGNLRHRIMSMKQEWDDLYRNYLKKCALISSARRRGAVGLCRSIAGLLNEVGMTGARFEIAFSALPEDLARELNVDDQRLPELCRAQGLDIVEFRLSANPGTSLLPLSRVASGGELSRIMLALKHHFISDDVSTVILDEVDAGIGGQTADSVARQIKKLSRRKQILCVTHLAQIAVHADRHILVAKRISGGSTEVAIHRVDKEARIDEVARMIAGETADGQAKKLAESLLSNASLSDAGCK